MRGGIYKVVGAWAHVKEREARGEREGETGVGREERRLGQRKGRRRVEEIGGRVARGVAEGGRNSARGEGIAWEREGKAREIRNRVAGPGSREEIKKKAGKTGFASYVFQN